jgi:hypothetical protein
MDGSFSGPASLRNSSSGILDRVQAAQQSGDGGGGAADPPPPARSPFASSSGLAVSARRASESCLPALPMMQHIYKSAQMPALDGALSMRSLESSRRREAEAQAPARAQD